MIFTDGKTLISDKDASELHAFAASIGLKREWFRGENSSRPHYDLLSQKILIAALSAGATFVNTKGLIQKFKEGVNHV